MLSNYSPDHPEGLRAWVHQRLTSRRAPAAGDIASTQAKRAAAVLIALVLREDGVRVLFTRRAAHLSKHAGQISFPGGRMEAGETAELAAIRETHEEIGIDPDFIEPIGRLADYSTITGFLVTPVVALVHSGFSMEAARDEVAEIFEVPLAFLLDADNWRDHHVQLPERRVTTRALLWEGDRLIWGATAGMLGMLRHSLADVA